MGSRGHAALQVRSPRWWLPTRRSRRSWRRACRGWRRARRGRAAAAAAGPRARSTMHHRLRHLARVAGQVVGERPDQLACARPRPRRTPRSGRSPRCIERLAQSVRNAPGSIAVTLMPSGADLLGERLGQRLERELGRRSSRRWAGWRHRPGHRGDVDDVAAALRAHAGQHRLDDVDHAEVVGVEEPAHLRRRRPPRPPRGSRSRRCSTSTSMPPNAVGRRGHRGVDLAPGR